MTAFVLWLISSTGGARLVSRNGNEFKSFRTLSESLGPELKGSAILDGEIVCLDGDGKSLFYDLLFRRGQPRFVALTCCTVTARI